MISQKEFEQLSRQEQNYRWALFLKSNGYTKNLSDQKIQQLKQSHLIKGLPLPRSYFEGR